MSEPGTVERCVGNALLCVTHGSRWWTSAVEPSASRCEHVALRGQPHVHDAAGTRREIGTITYTPGTVHCACSEEQPRPAGLTDGEVLL